MTCIIFDNDFYKFFHLFILKLKNIKDEEETLYLCI